MADIRNLMGGAFTPPPAKHYDPPEKQLRLAMLSAGLEPPEHIDLDGKVHRFRSGTKGKASGDKTGWYVAFGDGVPAGRFGCWRSDIEQTWRADMGRDYTPAEEMAHARRMAEAKAARDAEREKKQEVAADTVLQIWSNAGAASASHPYLTKKGIQPHGARITGDGRLVVPLYSDSGELSSLQYIEGDGTKRYHPGGATGGKFWSVGAADTPGTVYLAEGFATAATIHEVTGRPCFIAYSASNLVPAAEAIKKSHADIVIVADNDESGVGMRYAEQASAKYGARVVSPPVPGDANDYHLAGHDLLELLAPKPNDWLIPADDFCAQPAPISWLVKHWLQDKALIMVHGPSGGGKTFVVLDMCLRIASGMDDWMGNRVRHGNVVYLAGEGHHGLRGRVAAWKQRHGAGSLSMWLSRAGCDLNTPAGYQTVAESLRALKTPPRLVVVDTLHRFLQGDENSAQDAKTMLDACNAIMAEFNCSVVLVHHTGVSDEAQHRARGSSAWRGALDVEISVVPAKGDGPLQIVQRKSKDAEEAQPVYAELESVAIDGWYDEDNEPVTSAILSPADAPAEPTKKDSKHAKHIKMLEAAWWHSGAEERGGSPYISRSGFLNYVTEKLGSSRSTAETYAKPSASGRPISELLIGGVIDHLEHGWVVKDNVLSSAWMMRR